MQQPSRGNSLAKSLNLKNLGSWPSQASLAATFPTGQRRATVCTDYYDVYDSNGFKVLSFRVKYPKGQGHYDWKRAASATLCGKGFGLKVEFKGRPGHAEIEGAKDAGVPIDDDFYYNGEAEGNVVLCQETFMDCPGPISAAAVAISGKIGKYGTTITGKIPEVYDFVQTLSWGNIRMYQASEHISPHRVGRTKLPTPKPTTFFHNNEPVYNEVDESLIIFEHDGPR